MGTFTLVPFGDLPDLRGDLGQRIQAECQSVQSTHLMGQNCYWQLRFVRPNSVVHAIDLKQAPRRCATPFLRPSS